MTRSQVALSLVVLAAVNAFGFMDRVMIALVAEKIKAEFLVSDFQIGLLGGTAFALVNALASVPIARMAERWKRTHVTAGFLLLASAFTALAGATASFVQLVACRLGMAAGNAATEAPPHSIISDMVPPDRRASAISVFMLGVPIASLLGSFGGGAIAESFGWRNTFVVFGVAGGVIGLMCLLVLGEPARRTASAGAGVGRPGTGAVLRILAGSPTVRFLLLGISCISLGSFGVNTFLPAFFAREHGLDAGQAGLTFGIVSGIASLIGTLAGGYGSEYLARRDRRWLVGAPALGTLIGAPVFVLGLYSSNLATAVPVMLLGSCAFYTVMGPAIATLHGTLDSYTRATGSALFLLAMHLIGQGLGPPVIGIVSDFAANTFFGGGFADACPGTAAQVSGSACARASALGLRLAIALFCGFFLLGSLFLFICARGTPRRQEQGASTA